MFPSIAINLRGPCVLSRRTESLDAGSRPQPLDFAAMNRLALVACVLATFTLAGRAHAQKKAAALERKLTKAATALAEDWWQARPPTRFEEWDEAVRAELE